MIFGTKKLTPEDHWFAFNLGQELAEPHTFAWVWSAVKNREDPWNYTFGEYSALHASYSAGWLDAS